MSKLLLGVLVILLVAGVAAFFVFRGSSDAVAGGEGGSVEDSGDTSTEEARVILVDASRYSFSPSTIRVRKGEKVRIVINSIDTTHGISIPAFGVSGIASVEFVPDEVGAFEFKCPTVCGEGHSTMNGTLVVE